MNDYQSVAKMEDAKSAYDNDKSLIVNIGKNSSGDIVAKDFSNYSNILVSGTTGSGKTSFVVSLLLSLMSNYPPNRIKFLIFDSKRVDYSFIQPSDYMLMPIINEPKKFCRAASILVEEAEKRIEMGVSEDKPDIFLIIDDYADVASYEESIITMQKLLKLSRTARIHVIMVTATPSSSIIPTEIKALIPYRIAFTTASPQASQMIIGQSGAERLCYPGEFIFKCGGDFQKYTAVCFENPIQEMKRINDNYMSQTSTLTDIAEEIFSDCSEELIEFSDRRLSTQARDDDLIEDAIAFIFKSKQASVSMLQRRFRIGYNRATAIIDEIEEMGIIGPSDGSSPRPILITEEEYYGSSGKKKETGKTPDATLNNNGFRSQKGLSNIEAMDSFNSLPESVRKIILDADDPDIMSPEASQKGVWRNTLDNAVFEPEANKADRDNTSPRISLELQSQDTNKSYRFVFGYEDISSLVYHKKTLFRKDYYSIGLKNEPVTFCKDLSSYRNSEKRINPRDASIYKDKVIMLKIPSTPEDEVKIKQFIHNIANKLGMKIQTV